MIAARDGLTVPTADFAVYSCHQPNATEAQRGGETNCAGAQDLQRLPAGGQRAERERCGAGSESREGELPGQTSSGPAHLCRTDSTDEMPTQLNASIWS